jgi:hypothetical protein
MPKAAKSPKKGAKKDPNAPKRALSAFMLFSQDKRQKVKEENPDASFGKLLILLILYILYIFSIIDTSCRQVSLENCWERPGRVPTRRPRL